MLLSINNRSSLRQGKGKFCWYTGSSDVAYKDKIRARVHNRPSSWYKDMFWNPRLSGFIGISERQVGWILYRHRQKNWGMFFLWYYSFETVCVRRHSHLWGEMRGNMSIWRRRKHVYCVCDPLLNSPCVHDCCQQQPKTHQIEPLEEKFVQNFKELHRLQWAELPLKRNKQWNDICRWFDSWMRKTSAVSLYDFSGEETKSTDLETQMKRVPFRK